MNESYEYLQRRVRELERENAVLLSENVPARTAWLQRKVQSQRAALDGLNRRVVSQRLHLAELERLGRGLSREEFAEAVNRLASDELKARILETA